MGRKKKEKVETPNEPSGPVHYRANGGPTGLTGVSELAEATILRHTEQIAGRRRSPTESTERGRKLGSKRGRDQV
jgi:hypothetical protein